MPLITLVSGLRLLSIQRVSYNVKTCAVECAESECYYRYRSWEIYIRAIDRRRKMKSNALWCFTWGLFARAIKINPSYGSLPAAGHTNCVARRLL